MGHMKIIFFVNERIVISDFRITVANVELTNRYVRFEEIYSEYKNSKTNSNVRECNKSKKKNNLNF